MLVLCGYFCPQAVFQMGDKDKDNYIDFREFLNYCVEHEKKLWLVFQAMDVNKDGEHKYIHVQREREWEVVCIVWSWLHM